MDIGALYGGRALWNSYDELYKYCCGGTNVYLSSVFLKIAAGELDYNGLLQWVIDHEKSEED